MAIIEVAIIKLVWGMLFAINVIKQGMKIIFGMFYQVSHRKIEDACTDNPGCVPKCTFAPTLLDTLRVTSMSTYRVVGQVGGQSESLFHILASLSHNHGDTHSSSVHILMC